MTLIEKHNPGIGFFDKRYLKLDASNDPLTGSLEINANITLSTNGATEGSPRTYGFSDFSTNEAARFSFGDNANAVQNSFGKAMQIYSFHSLQLMGNRNTTDALAFITDSNISVLIDNVSADGNVQQHHWGSIGAPVVRKSADNE